MYWFWDLIVLLAAVEVLTYAHGQRRIFNIALTSGAFYWIDHVHEPNVFSYAAVIFVYVCLRVYNDIHGTNKDESTTP